LILTLATSKAGAGGFCAKAEAARKRKIVGRMSFMQETYAGRD
jgi:hypothetical protein